MIILGWVMFGLFLFSILFIIYFIMSELIDLTPIKKLYSKCVTQTFERFKLRKNKVVFIPNESFFFDFLDLDRNESYKVAIQTIHGEWYYNAFLWFDYNSQFFLRVTDNHENNFHINSYQYKNTIAYISFYSPKIKKLIDYASSLSMSNIF